MGCTEVDEPDITLPPPQRTSLQKMRAVAARQANEIEGSQIARIKAGMITAPDPEQLAQRDAFDGLVRLIDIILASDEIKELLAP